tara:strand:- start:476 stop:1489 length:1014 start_codon:yes stop_codon:yes gene_type:complete
MAPIYHGLLKRNITQNILHSGQHYSYEMSEKIMKDLSLPKPNYNLAVGSGTHGKQTGKIMIEIEKIFILKNPTLVIVYGDVNTTLAATITAKKLNIKVAHVESGLRSRDMTMAEEQNRIMVDSISDILFVTEESGMRNLKNENISGKAYLVGNTMIDSLVSIMKNKRNLNHEKIILSFHRPYNVDKRENLDSIINFFANREEHFLWPIHFRTKQAIENFNLKNKLGQIKNLEIKDPLGYCEFIRLLSGSRCIITDSGGIQEEATYLKVPCLTFRKSTERPVTIEKGTNTLTPSFEDLTLNLNKILIGDYKTGEIPKYWDGDAASRIVDIIINKITDS